MSVAHAPADMPVAIACPKKTYADGREIRFLKDTVEVHYYVNLRSTTGIAIRSDVACIVISRSNFMEWLREALPMALDAAQNQPGLYAVQ
jgi:hypothetical protein